MKKLSMVVGAFFILVFSNATYANSPICQDIARLSCLKQVYPDGTWDEENDGIKNLENSIAKQRNQAESEFLSILDKPENKDFYKLALSATGLSLAPHCNSKENADVLKCKNELAGELSHAILKRIYGPLKTKNIKDLYASSKLPNINYILDHPVWNQTMEKLEKGFKEEVVDKKVEEKIREKVFPNIKELFIAKIKNSPNMDDELKEKLIFKIDSIRFDGTSCGDGVGGVKVMEYLIPNAYYSPDGNRFRFCHGLAIYNKSEFHWAFVVAHELAHAIDPCGIANWPDDLRFHYSPKSNREKKEAENPFSSVLQCLRNPNSIEAKAFSEQNKDKNTDNEDVRARANNDKKLDDAHKRRKKPKINEDEDQDYNFCEEDQITESFSDWIAAELLPSYIKDQHPKLTEKQKQYGFSNTLRGFGCEDMSSFKDVHPNSMDRINKIILVQPDIRKEMGCTKPHTRTVYCKHEVDKTEKKQTVEQPARKNKNDKVQ